MVGSNPNSGVGRAGGVVTSSPPPDDWAPAGPTANIPARTTSTRHPAMRRTMVRPPLLYRPPFEGTAQRSGAAQLGLGGTVECFGEIQRDRVPVSGRPE